MIILKIITQGAFDLFNKLSAFSVAIDKLEKMMNIKIILEIITFVRFLPDRKVFSLASESRYNCRIVNHLLRKLCSTKKVIAQMSASLPEADEVVVLAGDRYRENLLPYLRSRFSKVTIPMEGLTSGRQLNWLSHAKNI